MIDPEIFDPGIIDLGIFDPGFRDWKLAAGILWLETTYETEMTDHSSGVDCRSAGPVGLHRSRPATR